MRSVDLSGASEQTPVVLPVVGEIPAGSRHPLRLQPGQAVRVVAGAPLPTLADAVVPVGHTDAGTAKLTVTRGVPSAAFVRRIGEDVQPGDVAVRRDAVLGAAPGRDARRDRPRQGARAPAAAGVGDLGRRRAGRRRPHARAPGRCRTSARTRSPPPPATRAPRPARAGLVRGDARELAAAVQDRLPFTDVLVVCGAVGGAARAPRSQAALADLGELDTTRVAMHPGSTQGFGRLGPDGVPTFLFPSHPATALLLFEVLVRPLIRLALGLTDPYRRTVSARLTSPVTSVARSARLPARSAAARPAPATTSCSRSAPPARTCCRRWPTATG